MRFETEVGSTEEVGAEGVVVVMGEDGTGEIAVGAVAACADADLKLLRTYKVSTVSVVLVMLSAATRAAHRGSSNFLHTSAGDVFLWAVVRLKDAEKRTSSPTLRCLSLTRV